MNHPIQASSHAHDAYTRGLLLDEDDQVDQAVDAFQEAIESGDPEWGPKAAFQLGMILREGGDEAGGERAYRQVIDSSDGPELGAALLNLGALLMERNKREAAKETLSRALELGGPTERGGAAANLGNLAKDQGDIESAQRFFELAMECSRDNTPEADDLLEALEAAGRTAEVQNRKDALREARVAGGTAGAEHLAKLLMEQGNHSGAVDAFRQAIAFGHPEGTPRAEAELAGQLLPVDEAKKVFHEVIASGHDKWGPMASVNLGVLLEEEGDLQGAKDAYRRGSQFTDPESGGRAARYLGDLQAQEGDVAGAVESYRRAMESEGEDGVAAAFSLASLLATSGDRNGAAEIYERLAQMPWPEVRSEAQRELRELKGSALGRLFHRR
ncbi:MAG TPA: tetratricopeptide repeat protein [Candidatus Polarisedimenticolia bacterium]|nr:tetratricopeptide repeat protein [Candidatus Polarisedimenticolia bacterium]